jgi:hypothetical protein
MGQYMPTGYVTTVDAEAASDEEDDEETDADADEQNEFAMSTDGKWVIARRDGIASVCIRCSSIIFVSTSPHGTIILKLVASTGAQFCLGANLAMDIDAIEGRPRDGTIDEFIDRLVPGYGTTPVASDLKTPSPECVETPKLQ